MSERALHVVKDEARQIMPPLDADIEAALRESIRIHGVMVPIAVDQDGQIIDGHNRARIAGDLNMGCPTNEHHVEDETAAQELARTLNADRRQLTAEQRAQAARTLRDRKHSLRAIAGALKVDKRTVGRDLNELQEGHDAPPVVGDEVAGTDGKVYPAKRIEWTVAMKRDALARYEAGETREALAAEFGISESRLFQVLRDARETPPVEAESMTGNSRDAVTNREQVVREMAGSGAHSSQIAVTLGIGEPQVKKIAKRLSIEIIGDKAIGRSRHHDSNRIVEQMALDLDGVTSGLPLIDYAALDADRIEEWATSISESLRALSRFRNQLKNQLKEMTQ